MNIRNIIALVLGSGVAMSVHASVVVTDAWVKATAPGQTTAAAYLKIKSDASAKLIGVSSPVAKVSQLHEMKVQDNVMHMRPINSLDLPAGKTIELKPGDYHIMMENIVKPMMAGEVVPLTLTVEGADMKRKSIKVKAEVRSTMPMEKQDDMKNMGNMGNMKGM